MRFLCRILIPLLLVTGCKKEEKPKLSKRAQREQLIAEATEERLAVTTFANQLRTVFEWRKSQPQPADDAAHAATVKALHEKLCAVPCQNLPADLAQPWAEMLAAWQQLAAAPAANAQLQQIGAKAAAALDAALVTRGIDDVRF